MLFSSVYIKHKHTHTFKIFFKKPKALSVRKWRRLHATVNVMSAVNFFFFPLHISLIFHIVFQDAICVLCFLEFARPVCIVPPLCFAVLLLKTTSLN